MKKISKLTDKDNTIITDKPKGVRLTTNPVYNTRMGWWQVSMMNETITDKNGYQI